MRATRILTVTLALLVMSIGQSVATPLTLNHQGLLTDNSGVPLSGAFSLTFKLYSVPTAGVSLWTETQTVTATNGLYQATLGSITPLSPSLFSGSPPAQYLGVTVGADPELAPRAELSSAPFSLHSKSVDGFDPGTGNVSGGQHTFIAGDNNSALSDFSSIAGGHDNFAEAQNFADTVFDTTGIFDPGGSPFPPSSGSLFRATPGPPFIGGGVLNVALGSSSVVAGGSDNLANGAFAGVLAGCFSRSGAAYDVVGGGFRNQTLLKPTNFPGYQTIGGGLMNDIQGNFLSFIGGGYRNIVDPQINIATISGGFLNRAGDHATTVGGGFFNVTRGFGSFIGGGGRNATGGNFGGVAGGERNVALVAHATVGGGQLDSALGTFSTISGGSSNTAVSQEAFIGGGGRNRAEGLASTIGGGQGNLTSVQTHQFIGGGQDNIAKGQYSTIGGGRSNETGVSATVGGGFFNKAFGDNTFIGGGLDNIATAITATVGGGVGNVASGPNSFVGGGDGNIAGPGDYATVPGGFRNIASAPNSFAAGNFARALDTCAFVWSDCCRLPGTTTNQPYESSLSNSFNARALNGFYFLTSCDSVFDPASGVGSGVYVPAGGSMWMTGSSRTLKKNITPVDGGDILDKIEQMPVYRWSYKSQGDDVEHIGPMAEEFYATFKLGDDEKSIGAMDPAGVSLAATKALIKENKELKERLERLEKLVSNLVEQN